MQQRQIILASGSPRRKDLLARMGVRFQVVVSNFDEQLDDSRSPEEVAKELGLGKALAVAQLYPDAIVIGSDSIVSIGDRQIGKPTDKADARAIHQLLSGQCHLISSSVAVVCLAEHVEIVDVARTQVCFKPYDREADEVYLETGNWGDKAGGYGIQNGADIFVDYVKGRYDTVLGLPTKRLAEILQSLGVDAHEAGAVPPPNLRFK